MILDKITGKTIAGAGIGVGEISLFFDDGTMLHVEVLPRRKGELPRDIQATFATYEQEENR
jgi:hypothetical protein